jgi:orotate phosphoribosyltransferase
MLFKFGNFTLHSGSKSNFKIDCDALSDQDIESLAESVAAKFQYKQAVGVPRGGIRFAEALNRYRDPKHNLILIVDDVLTTGKSMIEYADKFKNEQVQGIVIFARNICPEWIVPIFIANNEVIK